MKKHIVILIPGLGNFDPYLRFISQLCLKLRISLVIHNAEWKENEIPFQSKIDSLKQKAQFYRRKGAIVSLVGISAGGSLALIVMHELGDEINACIVYYARLKTSYNILPMQQKILKRFPAHFNTVSHFEKHIAPFMAQKEKKRIMTIRPVWDDIVPVKTMTLIGAHNKKVWLLRHSSLLLAIPLFGIMVKHFINHNYYAN
jgi:hypothetical protein